MVRFISLAALMAVGATLAYAQGAGGAAVAERKAAMKAVGGASKSLSDMAKGDVPFDAAKAAASFKDIENNLTKASTLFTDDSKTGGGTTALPTIWEKKADFTAKFQKAAADAKAAAAASTDEASFKAQLKTVGANCGGCHRDYRESPKR